MDGLRCEGTVEATTGESKGGGWAAAMLTVNQRGCTETSRCRQDKFVQNSHTAPRAVSTLSSFGTGKAGSNLQQTTRRLPRYEMQSLWIRL